MANSNVYKTYEKNTQDLVRVINTYRVKDDAGNLRYFVQELEKKTGDGSTVRFFKSSEFFRLTRVSQQSKENKEFMEIHTDIVRAMYRANVNFIEIIANILRPDPIGTVFLYGVQGVGNTKEEAIKNCHNDFEGMRAGFQGTHRTSHISGVDNNIMTHILNCLSHQKHVSIIKGIPASKTGSGDSRNVNRLDVSTNEQLEQFLAGSDAIEYVLVLMATPLNNTYLNHWLTKSLEEQTKWERQKQGSTSLGLSVGIPLSVSQNISNGTSTNSGKNVGSSTNTGGSHTTSTNENKSHTDGTSENSGWSKTDSSSWNQGSNTSTSTGTNEGSSHTGGLNVGAQLGIPGGGPSVSVGGSTSDSTSIGSSKNNSVGESSGIGGSNSNGITGGTGTTSSDAISKGSGESNGDSWGEGRNNGSSYGSGTSNSKSSGFGTGMNLGFNMSKSYQWTDMTVQYICELLGEQNKRLKQMANGDGGFYVDMYISTGNKSNQKALEGVAQVTWVNANSMIDMLRLETPDEPAQKQLASHLMALSPNMEIVYNPNNKNGYYYKYCSVLASKELAGYCHPPRISIGGLDNTTEDIPQNFAVPTSRQNGEIMIGHVLAPSRYSYEMSLQSGNGYATPYKYCVFNNEMHHAFISGGSRSGKSVLATRAVLQMYNNAPYKDRYGNVKKKRILVLDPKGEWRKMGTLLPKGKFKFHSIGNPLLFPLKMNVLRVPRHVSAYNYYNLVVEHFCSAYGLLERAIAQIGGILYDLYEKNQVFDNPGDPNWANEHSKDITLEDVCIELDKKLKDAIATRNNHDAEAIQTYLTRLDMYRKKHSCEYVMFCNRGGESADILLGKDDFTVVESNGLSASSMRFFFILLMNSIYEYALASGPEGFYTDSYETVIVLEEANSVLIAGQNDESGQKSINRFNELIDKSASLGLFFWVITQKIASMPKSVIANSGIVFIGRNAQGEDVKVINAALGFDDKRNPEMNKFYPRMTTGMFIAKCSKGRALESQTPVLIQASMVKSVIPSDNELRVIMDDHILERKLENE